MMDNPQEEEPERKSRAGQLFQLKIDPAFRTALDQEAKKERRSLTNWMLLILADKINWKGDV